MNVKPANPEHAVGFVDPVTKRRPFIDSETGAVLESAHVPDTTFWVRRWLAGELVKVDEPTSELVRVDEPTGREPVTPLTTRGKE
jgi:hypothetical protein